MTWVFPGLLCPWTYMLGVLVLSKVDPLANWLRWGCVPCEENGGRIWLPLRCIVALEWLVDAKHGVVALVCYCTCL